MVRTRFCVCLRNLGSDGLCTAARRENISFDIQHRTVASYKNDAPEDFMELQQTITKRLRASMEKAVTMQALASSDEVIAPVGGLGKNEVIVLAILGGSLVSPEGAHSLWNLQQDCEKAGLTRLGCTLGLRKLLVKKFVRMTQDADDNGHAFDAVALESAGWQWIEGHEDEFVLRKGKSHPQAYASVSITDEDIPF